MYMYAHCMHVHLKAQLQKMYKTATLAQAGIYGVGQLANVENTNITVVVLFKDKSTQVALANKHTTTSPMEEGSVDEVSYKFVH